MEHWIQTGHLRTDDPAQQRHSQVISNTETDSLMTISSSSGSNIEIINYHSSGSSISGPTCSKQTRNDNDDEV